MATKNEELRNTLANAFGDAWNQGGAADGSKLNIKDVNGNILVAFTLDADAFEPAGTGTISAKNGTGNVSQSNPKTVQAQNTGEANSAELISADGVTYKLTGLTVGTSNAQVIISSTSITSGDQVSLTQFDWTEPNTIQAA